MAWTVNDPAEQTYLLRHLHVPIITDGLTQGGPVDPIEVSHWTFGFLLYYYIILKKLKGPKFKKKMFLKTHVLIMKEI